MMASVVREPGCVARVTASRVATPDAVALTTASTEKMLTPAPATRDAVLKEATVGLRTMLSEAKDVWTGRRMEASAAKLDVALEATIALNENALALLDMIAESILSSPTALERITASADRLDAAVERMTALASKVDEIEALMAAFDPNRPVPDRMMVASTAVESLETLRKTAERMKLA
jgi:hypothetical protein